MLTDHKALESWYNEHLDTPSGPLGRRGRCNEVFSRFYLTVEYLQGEDNLLPDVLSRWHTLLHRPLQTSRSMGLSRMH